MKIFITGGSGFVGQVLSERLLSNGHAVTAVGMSLRHTFQERRNFRYMSADTTKPGDWQNALKESNAVINLAGRNIFKYWTKRYKDQIYSSRILTTRNIVDAVSPGSILCSTSAAGYYGDRSDEPLNENAAPGSDFLAAVCVDWEKEALKAEQKGVRVVLTRFGVVLGKNGGALSKMLPAFKLGMGGPLGNGRHWFPWIHLDDLISAINHILMNADIHGPVNFTSPGSVRQKDFAKALGRALKRPAVVPLPAFVLKIVMGELGAALLSSQKTIPDMLVKNRFTFGFPDIETALRNIVT